MVPPGARQPPPPMLSPPLPPSPPATRNTKSNPEDVEYPHARTLQALPAGHEVSHAPSGQQHTAAKKACSTRGKNMCIYIYTYIYI